ncbi:FAD-dependent monooxygenase [Streptomyces yaizuensis]|uniref:Flavin-dependent oxidoreductase n=1 Tax=Streptomyces yaizuensis TaxID=2989713 RepID=A0ABQ5NSF3_9ACTN|nr:FAD-dependent monooxygenase [Streptomyces sp. YSPA8]GLF93084.1 flavin-dependent oxidoreductase [Streptomyces sp. YSPA8]
MTVLIAGAGIAGLTTALSLHAAGVGGVRVLEAVPELQPVGVGLNILPNAVRELDELGLLPALAAVSAETAGLGYYDRRGRLVWSEPRGRDAGYRWPQLSVHRGGLQFALAVAVGERLGADAIVTDARVEGFAQLPGGRVEVAVRHPAAGAVSRLTADVLIGADGAGSAVRAGLHPGEGPSPGNGLVVWRGTTWAAPFLDGRSMVITGDDRRRAVVHPLSPPGGEDDRALVNWAVARVAGREAAPGPAGAHRPVHPRTFVDGFADLAFGWLDVPGLIRGSSEAYAYHPSGRDPLPRWSEGAVTLIGDAAHAMHPMGSNGATQTIIDARVLARELALRPDPREALAAYEEERLPVRSRLRRTTGHGGCGEAGGRRETFPGSELEDFSADFARLGGFDPDTVNNRPSYGIGSGATAHR